MDIKGGGCRVLEKKAAKTDFGQTGNSTNCSLEGRVWLVTDPTLDPAQTAF